MYLSNKPFLSLTAGIVVLISAFSAPVASSTDDPSRDVDKLMIVDCMLPGKIMRLGAGARYMSARRPTKPDPPTRIGSFGVRPKRRIPEPSRAAFRPTGWFPYVLSFRKSSTLDSARNSSNGLGQLPNCNPRADGGLY